MATVFSHRHFSTRARERRAPYVEVRRSVAGLGYAARLSHKWGLSYVYLSRRPGYLVVTPCEREEDTEHLLCVVGNLTPPEAIVLLREEVLAEPLCRKWYVPAPADGCECSECVAARAASPRRSRGRPKSRHDVN
jgi:hypothetical protein